MGDDARSSWHDLQAFPACLRGSSTWRRSIRSSCISRSNCSKVCLASPSHVMFTAVGRFGNRNTKQIVTKLMDRLRLACHHCRPQHTAVSHVTRVYTIISPLRLLSVYLSLCLSDRDASPTKQIWLKFFTGTKICLGHCLSHFGGDPAGHLAQGSDQGSRKCIAGDTVSVLH